MANFAASHQKIKCLIDRVHSSSKGLKIGCGMEKQFGAISVSMSPDKANQNRERSNKIS